MANHLAIICHIEPLPVYETGKKTFSLNIATMWVGGAPGDPANVREELDQMMPWKWEDLNSLELRTMDKASGNVSPGLSIDITKIDDSSNAQVNAIRQRFGPGADFAQPTTILDRVMARLSKGGKPVWENFSGVPGGPSNTEGREPGYGFSDVMAYLSTLPYPLAQSLNLSFCVDIDSALDASKLLFLVPQFKLEGSERTLTGVPKATRPLPIPLPADGRATAVYQWKYTGSTPEVCAYVKPFDLAELQSHTTSRYINLENYWVRRGRDAATVGDAEWITGLEDRAALGFDLGQRIIDVLRQVIDDAESGEANKTRAAFSDSIWTLRNMTVAALRDSAGMGLRPWYGGGSTMERFIDRVVSSNPEDELNKKENIEEVKKRLREYDAGMTLDKPQGWKALLRDVIPELKDTPALRDTPDLATVQARREVVDLPRERDELEQVQAALSNKTTLRQVVLAQWDNALSTAGDQNVRQWWTKNSLEFKSFLNEIPLRSSLLREAIAPAWPGILKEPSGTVARNSDWEVDALRKQFVQQIGIYLDQRFDPANPIPGAPPYKKTTPRIPIAPAIGPPASAGGPSHQTTFKTKLQEKLATLSTQYFKDEIVPERLKGGANTPTPVPHPVLLQIDSLFVSGKEESAEQTADSQEIARRIAGVGVWARRRRPAGTNWSDADWHCLNLAAVHAGGSAFDPKWAFYENKKVSDEFSTDRPELSPRSLVPYRLSLQNETKNVVVAYDNEPLIATSARIDLSGGKALLPEDPAEAGTDLADMLSYLLAKDPSTSAWEKLPMLHFGDLYEFVINAVGNSGALPPALYDSHPARLRSTSTASAKIKAQCATDDFRKEYLHSHRYWRRVRVGAPRIVGASQAKANQLDVPRIPQEVNPLAPEIGSQTLSRSNSTRFFFRDESERRGLLFQEEKDQTGWTCTIGGIVLPSGILRIDIEQPPLTAGGSKTVLSVALKRDASGVVITVNSPVSSTSAPVTGAAAAFAAVPLEVSIRYSSGKLEVAARVENRDGPHTIVPAPGSPNGPINVTLAQLEKAYVVMAWTPTAGGTNFTPISYTHPHFVLGAAPVAVPDDARPLLMLMAENLGGNDLAKSSFEFRLRKPATDLVTWDRWVEHGEPGGIERRQAVWAAFHMNVSEPGTSRDHDLTKYDLTIDDPAVADFLIVELNGIRGKFAGKSRRVKVPIPSAPAPPLDITLKSEQAGPVQFTCSTSETEVTEPLSMTGSQVTVRLGPGEIAELVVYAAVLKSHFHGTDNDATASSAKFPRDAMVDLPDYEANHVLVSPMRLLIETVTDASVTPEALWQDLVPAFRGAGPVAPNALEQTAPVVAATNKSVVEEVIVRLARRPSPESDWAFISRVELWRQVWRWSGRSTRPFPQVTEPNAPPGVGSTAGDNLLLWDAEGFAERSEGERDQETIDLKAGGGAVQIYTESVVTNPRKLYYRFGARAFHRYRGFFKNPPVVQARRKLTVETEETGDIWKRLVVPSRFRDAVSAPSIKFVVPLTESDGSTGSENALPGHLVVLNEAWFEIGGLAESLQAAIVEIKNPPDAIEEGVPVLPVLPPLAPSPLYEFGPDPVLTGKLKPAVVRTNGPPVPGGPQQGVLKIGIKWPGDRYLLENPAGFSFDPGKAQTPLFNSSCFIMPAPTLNDAQNPVSSEKYSWNLARVQFRRVIQGTTRSEDRFSSWTPPMWIQYLPNAFGPLRAKLEEQEGGPLKLRVKPDERDSIQWTKDIPSLSDLMGLSPSPPSDPDFGAGVRPAYQPFNHWSYVLLVTQQFSDIRGRVDQERFVQLMRYDEGASSASRVFRPLTRRVPLDQSQYLQGQLKGRLIIIQHRLESLWSGSELQPRRPEASYPLQSAGTWQALAMGRELFVTLGAIRPKQRGNMAVPPKSLKFFLVLEKAPAKGVGLEVIYELGRPKTVKAYGVSIQQVDIPNGVSTFDLRIRLTGLPAGYRAKPEIRHEGGTWQELPLTGGVATVNPVAIPGLATASSEQVWVSIGPNTAGENGVHYLPPSFSGEPWEHLFPVGNEQVSRSDNGERASDAQARIVHVSIPIPILKS